MKVVLDTNRYTDFMSGVEEAVAAVQRATHVFIPFVVLAELRYGFACGSRCDANERRLVEFLDSPRVSILWPDVSTVDEFVRLQITLRERGRPMPMHDLWIAAFAVQHRLMLCTRDSHFDALPQVARI